MNSQANQKIAVVGAAVHLPQTRDAETFWRLLCEETLFLQQQTDDTLLQAGVDPALLRQPHYVKWAAPLDDIAAFDAEAFAMTPKEAEIAGPQLRSLLHCARSALSQTAIRTDDPEQIIGVFTGVGGSDYMPNNLAGRPDIVASVGHKTVQFGNDNSFVATQIAYKLNLTGPAVNFSTACSSSLVAAHHARKSLLDHECDVALVGGSKISSLHQQGYLYQSGGIRSKDGYCRTFDASASGTVSGNGTVVLVMMRLSDAIAQRRPVWAVLHGSAINNDGAVKVGYTAPGVEGQAAVIATALADAQVDAGRIGLVEAHGTATPMGDPVEVAALTAVYREYTGQRQYCALGAVKSNLGHLGAASGLLGLLKATFAVRDGKIPATLHFNQANPALQLEQSPFYVNARTMEWAGPASERLAAVSSFGMGGTNAHMILSGFTPDTPLTDALAAPAEPRLILLSDLTSQRLGLAADALCTQLTQTAVSLANVERTLALGRTAQPVRQALVATGPAELVSGLRALAQNPPVTVAGGQPEIVMMFPGQGAQHQGMLSELYRSEVCFRDSFDHCARLLAQHDGLLLTPYLRDALPLPDDTALIQPLLFAVEYSLYRCWQQLGVQADLVAGHSLGELVAATVAGCFTLEHALVLVRERGKLMAQAPAGAMLSVDCPAELLAGLLPAQLDVAAVNADGNRVLAGELSLLEALQSQLELRGIHTRWISRRYAFHSSLMTECARSLQQLVDRLDVKPLTRPLLSNLTGAVLPVGTLLDGAYWAGQLRNCVQFDQVAVYLRQNSTALALEVGPGQVLSQLLNSQDRQLVTVASQPHPKTGRSQKICWLEAIAQLWQRGVSLQLTRWLDSRAGCMVQLATEARLMQEYWVQPVAISQPAALSAVTPVSAALPASTQWLHLPKWQQVDVPRKTAATSLLVVGATPSAEPLVAHLRAAGASVNIYAGTVADLQRDWQQLLTRTVPAAEPLSLLLLPDAWGQHSLQADSHDMLTLCTALLNTIGQSHVSGQAGARPVHVNLLLSPLWDILDPARQTAQTAQLQALLLCAEQEYPALRTRLIDLDIGAVSAADCLVLLQLNAQDEGLLYPTVLRAGQCFQRRYLPAPETALPGCRLKAGGTYLITGGLGGMGLAFAGYLASQYQANLILLSRHAEQAASAPAAAGALDRIRRSAASLQVLSCDVSDYAALAQVLRACHANRRIDGIIHAAGIAASQILARIDQVQLNETAAAKVAGTRHLLALCRQYAPEFLLLCSSQSALKGGAGQYAYSAANNTMDQLARAATDMPCKVISVNWCRWADSGMASQRLSVQTGRGQQVSAEAISDTEGCQLLEQVLQLAEPQIVVSKFAVDDVIRQYRQSQQRRPALQAGQARSGRSRPALPTSYVAPESPLQTRLVAIWQQILGIEQIGIKDNFFALGGNSLLLGQLLLLLRNEFQTELTIAQLYNALTIDDIARLIFTQSVAAVQDEDLALLLAELEQLDAAQPEHLILQD